MDELNGTAIKLLDAIGRADNDSTPALAEYAGISKEQAGQVLRRLQSAGLLSTSTAVFTEGRGRRGRLVWALTQAGQNVVDRYAWAMNVVRHTSLSPTDFARDENGCWIWAGRPDAHGYCRVNRNGVGGAKECAHRYVFEQLGGDIPPGLQLDHLCRNRACVCPDHLEPVTNAENSRRSANTRLTPEQVQAIRDAPGTQEEVARRFGIQQGTVSKIRLGYRWANA
jgi:DNA-binding MarR family transcriptional regulator